MYKFITPLFMQCYSWFYGNPTEDHVHWWKPAASISVE